MRLYGFELGKFPRDLTHRLFIYYFLAVNIYDKAKIQKIEIIKIKFQRLSGEETYS